MTQMYAQPVYQQPVYQQPVYQQPVYPQPTMVYQQPAMVNSPAPQPYGYVQQPAMVPGDISRYGTNAVRAINLFPSILNDMLSKGMVTGQEYNAISTAFSDPRQRETIANSIKSTYGGVLEASDTNIGQTVSQQINNVVQELRQQERMRMQSMQMSPAPQPYQQSYQPAYQAPYQQPTMVYQQPYGQPQMQPSQPTSTMTAASGYSPIKSLQAELARKESMDNANKGHVTIIKDVNNYKSPYTSRDMQDLVRNINNNQPPQQIQNDKPVHSGYPYDNTVGDTIMRQMQNKPISQPNQQEVSHQSTPANTQMTDNTPMKVWSVDMGSDDSTEDEIIVTNTFDINRQKNTELDPNQKAAEAIRYNGPVETKPSYVVSSIITRLEKLITEISAKPENYAACIKGMIEEIKNADKHAEDEYNELYLKNFISKEFKYITNDLETTQEEVVVKTVCDTFEDAKQCVDRLHDADITDLMDKGKGPRIVTTEFKELHTLDLPYARGAESHRRIFRKLKDNETVTEWFDDLLRSLDNDTEYNKAFSELLLAEFSRAVATNFVFEPHQGIQTYLPQVTSMKTIQDIVTANVKNEDVNNLYQINPNAYAKALFRTCYAVYRSLSRTGYLDYDASHLNKEVVLRSRNFQNKQRSNKIDFRLSRVDYKDNEYLDKKAREVFPILLRKTVIFHNLDFDVLPYGSRVKSEVTKNHAILRELTRRYPDAMYIDVRDKTQYSLPMIYSENYNGSLTCSRVLPAHLCE